MEDIVQNKKDLYIIGADGLARELEMFISTSDLALSQWVLKGFLYDLKDNNPLDAYPSDYKILGNWSDFEFKQNDAVLIGVASPIWRQRIYDHLKDKVEIASFVYDTAIVSKFSSIPEGTIILNNVGISTNVKLGKACFFNGGTQVGHDVIIGDFCSFMAHVDVGGFTTIGEKSFVGSGATIIPKRKIASRTTIGAGSVVIRNFKKEGLTLFGNPAEKI